MTRVVTLFILPILVTEPIRLNDQLTQVYLWTLLAHGSTLPPASDRSLVS